MRIIYLDIDSWVGHDPRAKHYYGSFDIPWHGDEDYVIEVEKEITKKDFKELIRNNDEDGYYIGMSTRRFNSKKELVEKAIELLEKEKIEYDLLLEGRQSVASVQKALAGPPELVKKINELYQENEKYCYASDDRNDQILDEIDERFQNLLEEFA